MENRWWENYAVRYFVGTVVGSAVITLLNTQAGSPFHNKIYPLNDFKETQFLGLGLAAALGLAYCYVASAPVLAVHAMRAHLRISAVRSSLLPTALCVFAPIVVMAFVLRSMLPVLAANTAAVVIGFQIGLMLLALVTRGRIIEAFYRTLAKNRARANTEKDKPRSSGEEYITSYRHLREHGNAFSIVLLEGLLAFIVFQCPSPQVAGLVLLIWSLPAASSWLLSTMLEGRFVANPLP